MSQQLVRCEIRWSKQDAEWCFRFTDNPTFETLSDDVTKRQFIRQIVEMLKRRVANGEYGFSLRIRNQAGEYVDERTIPRSRDPKKSKG